jgi:diadenosine tetraphosphatase ApaH/serine/threonine PP2A family protein phosphatase
VTGVPSESRFLAIDGEHREILGWFREQPLQARENATVVDQVVLWYESEGPRVYLPNEDGVRAAASYENPKEALRTQYFREENGNARILDRENSPLVWITLPRRLRGVLWTAGAVTFTSTPLRTRFPRLGGLHRSFVRWIRQFQLVYDPQKRKSDLDYYLEGGIRNYDTEVRALPNAAAALRNGQYFVNVGATHDGVDDLCRQLRLRGVNCDAS